jgi:hypothetical protein
VQHGGDPRIADEGRDLAAELPEEIRSRVGRALGGRIASWRRGHEPIHRAL